jgi:hypothetical protein
MDGYEKQDKFNGENGKADKSEIFSKPVRAGKRTYFFDVKSTKGNDYYLTITESKKRMGDDGKFFYEKHKLFLYKEDFDKFAEGLTEAVAYIKQHQPIMNTPNPGPTTTINTPTAGTGFSDVNFEDLK